VNRDQADDALRSLGATYDRVAASMYTIDSHPALGFLRAGGLAGRTADVWAALSPEVDARWNEFAALGTALEQARADRARLKPSQSDWSMLRHLLEATLPATAAAMERSSAATVSILDDVNAAWTATTTAVSPVLDATDKLGQLADSLGEGDGVGTVRQRVTAATSPMLADPLTAAPGGTPTAAIARDLATLSADLGTVTARLAEAARVRDGYPERIAGLGTRIDEVAAAEQAVRTAFARAVEKVADPGLPPEPRAADVLRARVSDLDARRAAGQWHRLADDIAMLEASIAHALERARELTEAADGLLARRDELRGRLEAYRAKAARHRLDEDERLSTLHLTARDLLFTAPCDLHASTKAVHGYQKALTELVREDAHR